MIKRVNPSHQTPRPLKAKGEKRKKLCRRMVDIWNKTIRHKLYPESKASLTAQREERLIWFLEEFLGHEVSWEAYCQLVSEFGFLGKVTLDWALIPHNAYRALAGAVHGKGAYPEVSKDIPWGIFYERIKKKCQRSLHGPQWFQISQNLAKRLGQRVYQVWFADAALIEFTENAVTIQVNSAFKRDYILTYFFLDVAYAIQAAYPPINQIDIQACSPKDWKKTLG